MNITEADGLPVPIVLHTNDFHSSPFAYKHLGKKNPLPQGTDRIPNIQLLYMFD
jgi:hypothetical protein